MSKSALSAKVSGSSDSLSGKQWFQGAALATNASTLSAASAGAAPQAEAPFFSASAKPQPQAGWEIVPCPAHPEGHATPVAAAANEDQDRAMLAVGWAVVICTLYAWYRRKEATTKKKAGEKQVMIPMQPMENHNVVLIIARRDVPEKKPKENFSKATIPGTSLTLSRLNPHNWFAV